MKWNEFCALLSGLSAESPLGRVVSIRLENDPDTLKNFNKHQHKIRNKWLSKRTNNVTAEERDRVLEQLKQVFICMAK